MDKTFGAKLRSLRIAAGLTQEELAKKCGTSKQSISRYEKSDREPNIRTAKVIADALGVPLEYLAPDNADPGVVSDYKRAVMNDLFDKLPPEAQDLILVQLRAIAQSQADQGGR